MVRAVENERVAAGVLVTVIVDVRRSDGESDEVVGAAVVVTLVVVVIVWSGRSSQ